MNMNNTHATMNSNLVKSEEEDLSKSTSDNSVGANNLDCSQTNDSSTTSLQMYGDKATRKLIINDSGALNDVNQKDNEIDDLIKSNKRNQNSSFDSHEPHSKRICSDINEDCDFSSNSEPLLKIVTMETSVIVDDITGKNTQSKEEIFAKNLHSEETETDTDKNIKRAENKTNKSDNLENPKESLNTVSEMCIVANQLGSAINTNLMQKNETSNTIVRNLKIIQLDPLPKKQNETTSVSVDFLKSFKKSFNLMNRSNLEDFVLQKIVETIVNKSELSVLRQKNETLEQTIIKQRQRINDLAKQFRDLEMVHNRVVKDLENKSSGLVTPVKITRAVGLQVSQPRSKSEIRSLSIPSTYNQRVPSFPNRSPQRYTNSQNNSHGDLQQPKGSIGQQAKMIVQQQQAAQRHQSLIQQRQQNQINQRQNAGFTQNGRSPITLSSPGSQRNASVLSQMISNANVRQANSPVVVRKIIRPNLHEETKLNKLIDLTDEEDSEQKTYNSTKSKIHVKSPATLNSSIAGSGLILNASTSSKVPIQRISSNHFLQITPKVGSMSQNQITHQQIMKTTHQKRNHPAPLPIIVNKKQNTTWKRPPPRPQIRINNIDAGIVISWTIHEQRLIEDFDPIVKYQIYAYQETDQEPSTEYWRHVGDVKAMALPMAVTLTEFQEGQKYHFAVRAVDIHDRLGPFSAHRTWDEKT
ncbi:putative leucine-rich repeat-containing protein DDB_G0290503 isoform X2 [Culicoides brevitarsis]|uniref:putative leucine-rich repeat-containing protein DDB_G0290503 isoform X2 n=1 Tax=Culicoides brevitarsis TaxID=469753 RepID=UPI00307C60A6